jgi:hypothetical protein
MKKLLFSLSLLASIMAFNACSTDVELYADYKDIPVVYGLLDASQDTNFIRINRAFSGNNEHPINATEVALIEDSCNYPGKLKAYIVEYKAAYGGIYSPTGDTVVLDTMTVHDKQEGVFYAPDQKVYFTDCKTTGNHSIFGNNSPNSRFKYKLFIHRGNDTITAETGLVGGDNFKIITSNAVFNPQPSDNTKKLKFTPADNAVFYDVKMIFHYRESHNGGPFVDKEVVFSTGPKNIDELGMEEQQYYVVYAENLLFNLLEEAIGGDTVVNPSHPHVVRYFDPKPMEIIVSAGGDELYNYIQVNQQTGYSQTIPDYTNVSGGYGVFSSRINLSKYVTISGGASSGIYGRESWGFKQQ